MDGVAQNLLPRVAISALERAVYIQKPSLLERGDGEGNRAGPKDLLKFLFGKFPIPLRFRKGGLGELQI